MTAPGVDPAPGGGPEAGEVNFIRMYDLFGVPKTVRFVDENADNDDVESILLQEEA